ncbi:hypothetical protein [Streptomyces sp. NPDC014894]|uniref:hypothetical protein n=1 Tax=unclassified Streptomyces TaxID=2593676 RepID=UPI0036FBA368
MTDEPTLPPVAAPYLLPFHYGALHNIGLDFLVDPAPVRALLAERHPDLRAADFGGRACVTLNHQLYFAQYPNGGAVIQEIEYSVVARPAASGGRLARLSYEEYARGYDQTKLLGIARLHVLCDSALAIAAGTALYGEPKYPAWFEVTLPSPNGPGGDVWEIVCKEAVLSAAGDGIERGERVLLSFSADLTGLPRISVNNTPITGYGVDAEGRPLAGPLNVYQPYQYLPLTGDGAAGRVRLRVHAPSSPVGAEVTALVGDAPAAGVWTYQSAPVAAHNRPYYVPRAREQATAPTR